MGCLGYARLGSAELVVEFPLPLCDSASVGRCSASRLQFFEVWSGLRVWWELWQVLQRTLMTACLRLVDAFRALCCDTMRLHKAVPCWTSPGYQEKCEQAGTTARQHAWQLSMAFRKFHTPAQRLTAASQQNVPHMHTCHPICTGKWTHHDVDISKHRISSGREMQLITGPCKCAVYTCGQVVNQPVHCNHLAYCRTPRRSTVTHGRDNTKPRNGPIR